MIDIPKELRAMAQNHAAWANTQFVEIRMDQEDVDVVLAAADEIERLRGLLADLQWIEEEVSRQKVFF